MNETNTNGKKPEWIAWLLLIPALIAAAVVGFVVFVVVLGLVLFAAAILMARVWWLRRKLRKSGAGETLEGEYVVIRERVTREKDGR